MGKTYVLDRVAADLARGFTHPAIQRLGSLVAAYPTDLDLRRRLAAVHRRVGNHIQAGRWDYLTIGADSHDTVAFERAFPSARARLREVRWPYRASQAATAYARSRLEKLVAAAEAERPVSGAAHAQRQAQRPHPHPHRQQVAQLGRRWLAQVWRSRGALRYPFAVAAAAAAFLVLLGAFTVVEQLVQ